LSEITILNSLERPVRVSDQTEQFPCQNLKFGGQMSNDRH